MPDDTPNVFDEPPEPSPTLEPQAKPPVSRTKDTLIGALLVLVGHLTAIMVILHSDIRFQSYPIASGLGFLMLFQFLYVIPLGVIGLIKCICGGGVDLLFGIALMFIVTFFIIFFTMMCGGSVLP